MSRRRWINRLFAPRPSAARRSGDRQRRLAVEKLEERTVPTVLDLTAAIGISGDINGATYTSVDPQPTGTGVIDPFVRIQRNPSNPSGSEQGYNTDGQEEFETKESGGHNWNHSLKLADLQEVDGFYQFTLDVNETKPGALIVLEELQVFVQSKPNLTGATFNSNGLITKFGTANANLVYDLDGAHVNPPPSPDGDSSVMLNYFLNRGSGSGDMTVLIPVSLFPEVRGKQFVYLYSKFSNAEAGFEEWTALLDDGGGGGGDQFSLSGRKFEDMNGDGNIVGDPVLSGWEINLYRESNGTAGLQIGGDTFIGSQSTGADGSFSFGGLEAVQTYYTTETLQSGWIQTYGGNAGNNFYTTLLNSDIIDLDFGNFELVDISGRKTTDITGNGFSLDDTGLGGVTINLFEESNGVPGLQAGDGAAVTSVVTALDGSYSFTDIAPGTYYVKEVVPDGYVQTGGPEYYTVEVGDDGVQSGGASNGNNFANFELFDICGEKYRDIDRDGQQDANEPLLSGWTIFLDTDDDGALDPGETSTVTGPNGEYCFTDLGPGTYIVREVQKPGWTQTSTNPPPISGLSGVNVEDVDFGNVLANPGRGHTKGYWHNQNGHDTIDEMGGWDVIKYELDNLFLRNLDGTLFVASNHPQIDFDGLLTNDSNASNAVSQLSAQIAAAYLNMRAGEAGLTDPEGDPFAIGDTLLSVPTSISPTGFITVSALVAEGRRILHGNNLVGPPLADYDLIDPSPERDYALLVMGALDAFNNSANIINA